MNKKLKISIILILLFLNSLLFFKIINFPLTWQKFFKPAYYFTNVTDRAFGKIEGMGNVERQSVLVIDYDNDGREDLFFPGNNGNKLFRNMGDGTFKDVSKETGVDKDVGMGTSAIAADFDNDGAIDIIVGHGLKTGDKLEGSFTEGEGRLTFYKNLQAETGQAKFKDITSDVFPKIVFPDGRKGGRYTKMLTASDIDGDGYLDLYQANRVDQDFNDYKNFRHRGSKNILWHNLGIKSDGTWAGFEDITDKASLDGSLGGVPHPKGYEPPQNKVGLALDKLGRPAGEENTNITHAAIFTDIDNDGDQDLIVANDFPDSFLILRNDSSPGKILFTNITGKLETMGGWMGIDSGDLAGDGNFDLFLTNVGVWNGKRWPNEILLNKGNGRFEKIGQKLDIKPDLSIPNLDPNQSRSVNLGSYEFGWGVNFLDFDNDGKNDIFWYGSLGHKVYEQVSDVTKPVVFIKGTVNAGRFLRNDGNLKFTEITNKAGVLDIYKPGERGLGAIENGSGLAIFDFNNDGFMDIVMGNTRLQASHEPSKYPVFLFKNNGNNNNWIKISLEGTKSNRSAVGAKVYVKTKNKIQVKEVKAGVGYASGSSLKLHFGLGKDKKLEEIKIQWPNRIENGEILHTTQIIRNVPSNINLKVTEKQEMREYSDPVLPSTIYNDEKSQLEYKKNLKKIKEEFDSKGSLPAYNFIKQEYYKNPNQKIFHNLFHYVGEQLYLHDGASGITICDETAGYGCFHGFLGSALNKEKNLFVKNALNFCQKDLADRVLTVECIHGIGHGILAFKGYKQDTLVDALSQCDQMSSNQFWKDICYSGIFMEYNIRTMQGINTSGYSIRPFKTDTPYDPCLNLPFPYQKRCFYELPYWWIAVMNSDFSKMGELCEKINDIQIKENCYQGIGHTIPWVAKNDKNLIIKQCNKMPDSNAMELCLEEIAKTFYYRKLPQPLDFCNNLDEQYKIKCLAGVKNFICYTLSICSTQNN